MFDLIGLISPLIPTAFKLFLKRRQIKKTIRESSTFAIGLIDVAIQNEFVRVPLREREIAECQRLIDADILQILTPENFRVGGVCTFALTERAKKTLK